MTIVDKFVKFWLSLGLQVKDNWDDASEDEQPAKPGEPPGRQPDNNMLYLCRTTIPIHLLIHSSLYASMHPYTYVCTSIHTYMHACIHPTPVHSIRTWYIHHPLYTHKDILSSTVHPCIHAFIHSSVHPSISQFICLSLYLSVHPSIHPLIRSSLYLLIQLLSLSSSVHPSIHPIIRPSLCLSIHPSCYLPTHLLVQSNGDHTFYHARQTGWVIPTASWV